MQNETFREADKLPLPVPAGTKSGDPVRIGELNGYAATDRANTSVKPYNSDGTPNTSYNWGGGNTDGNATVWLNGAPTFADSELEITEVGQPVFAIVNAGTGAITSLTTDEDNGETGEDLVTFPKYGNALNVKDDSPGPLTVRIAN